MIYIYLVELIGIFWGIYSGILKNRKFTSSKLKFWYSLSFSFILVSFLMRLYMFLVSKIQYLYLFKHIYYLNYIGIFMGALISIFIFLRSNKLKFNYIKYILLAGCIVYAISIFVNCIDIKLCGIYGYFMIFENKYYFMIFRVIFNAIMLFLSIYIIGNKFKDKLGGILVFFTAILGIVSLILQKENSTIIMDTITQLMWIITMNYSIITFKKN